MNMNTQTATVQDSVDRRTYTVDEIGSLLKIGRSSAYSLVHEGRFKVVRIGNAIRISRNSFDEWLDSLEG